MLNCVSVPNFVAIGQTVTKIWKFFKMAAAAVSVVHRIHKNDVQNLQAVHAKFSFFLVQNSDNPD